MIRKILMWCVMLWSLIALAGCDQKPDSAADDKESGKTTLTFLHRWPNEPFRSFFDRAVKDYQQQHPDVKINVISVLNEEYKQKINVLLASQTPPDIYFSWAGEYANKFIRENKALDLSDYAKADNSWTGNMVPSALDAFSNKGHLYGVPILMDVRLMVYNKALFARYGLQPPHSWLEFLTVLETLKKQGVTPLGFGNKAPWNGGLYITSLNARLVPPEVLARDESRSSPSFTDPGYVAALKALQQLLPYMNAYPNAVSREEERSQFVNGQIAIMPLHTIEFSYVKEAAFDWGIFNFPVFGQGKGDPQAIAGAPEGFMVSSQSKHPQAAMEFLKFLTSEARGEEWVKETGVLSTVKGTVTKDNATPQMREVEQQLSQNPALALWIDTALDGTLFQPYLADIQQMINGEKTPEAVMADIQQAATQLHKSKP